MPLLGERRKPSTDEDRRLIAPNDVGRDAYVNRNYEEHRAVKMAESFDIARAATAGYVVSERADGSLIWLDGQHRGAAAGLAGLGHIPVPMTVLGDLGRNAEAEWVLLFSEDRRRTAPAETHRLGANASRPVDVALRNICEKVGLVPDGRESSGHLRPVGAARKEVARDPVAFEAALTSLVSAYGSVSFEAPLLQGACFFFRKYPEVPASALAERLAHVDAFGLVGRARVARDQDGKPLFWCVTALMRGIYNKRKRAGALPPL